MEENARGGEREEPEVGREGGGRERLAARCEGDPRPGWSSSPGDGAHRWQRHETTDGATWPQAPGPGLCLMQCAPALAPLTLKASGAGWGGRQLACAPLLLRPRSSVLVGLWGGPSGWDWTVTCRLGASHPSSQQPEATPLGDLGPGQAQHSPAAPRANATAQHTGSLPQSDMPPCLSGWVGSPAMLLAPLSWWARGSGIPLPPQNQALQLGKAATHRHASGTHTCFSPAALTETRQRDDPQAPPQTCYQVPGPAKFPRACTMYENTHPCVHAPLCACVRACMYILHCSSHRGLTHPLPSSLHILQPQHPQTEQRQTTWR